MRRLLKRTLLVLLLMGAALEGAYLIAANVFLNSGLAPRVINRRPERFQIRWHSGWSLWPGMVTLREVEVRGRSSRTDWYAHLDSVSTRCHLRPLTHRTVHLASTRAAGVDFRLRRIRPPGAPHAVPPEELPTIPEFPGTPETRPGSTGGARRPGPPWTVLADSIDCDVEQLWIDRYRLTGGLLVQTPMRLEVRGPMEFSRVRLTMASGTLGAGERPIFRGLGIDATAILHPFVPRNARGLAFFRNLSGSFLLRSDDASLAFLEYYFKEAPWLHFKSRDAARLDLRLDHGRLRPGSAFEVTNDKVDIEFLDRHVMGKGTITGTVVESDGVAQSLIAVHLKEFLVAPLGSTEPFARGTEATILATNKAPDLSRPFLELEVVLDLPEARILDLRFYNSLIPPGSNFRLLSGTGTLGYHLEGSHQDRSLHGEIDLAVREGTAVFRNYKMHGSFRLKTRLRQASPRDMVFDISGTRLDLSTHSPAWSAAFTFPESRMSFGEPLKIDAVIRLTMQDTRPLVTMFDAFKGAPGWIERMMIIEDIRGRAALAVRPDKVRVRGLDITGHGLHALADLDLGKAATEGILYVRFHGFSLGIELRPGGKDLKLIRPLHWFEQQRADREGRRSTQRDGAP